MLAQMDFDWDLGNTEHIALHGVTAAEAEAAVQDPGLLAAGWYLRMRNGASIS
jgi:uncharacterized DUF497 family protein